MTLVEENVSQDQRPERVVAVRRIDTQIEAGDGRTISFRIAPFGEYALCADGLGGLPKGQPYREELMPGLYDKQLRAGNRILLNFEHQQGIQGVVGAGVELSRRSDGYHCSFRMHDNSDGNKALMLATEGVLQGASVESYWLDSVRSPEGVVQRVRGKLQAVAICREGAYPSAVMTGLRTDEIPDSVILDASLLPIPFDPELLERCRALGGIRMPQRYMAPPVETDPPDETGNPVDGTRQPTDNIESSEGT